MTRWPADAAFIEGERITVPGGRPFFILNDIFSTCHNRLVAVLHLGSIRKL